MITTTYIDPKLLHEHLRADYEAGLVYWKRPQRGIKFGLPVGTLTSEGYLKFQFKKTQTYVHRVIWAMFYNEWPKNILDHINQERADNRVVNLCESNHVDNALNSKLFSTNTTGERGVSVTAYGNYKVTLSGKYLGTYKTMQEAKDACSRHNDARRNSL